MRILPPVGVRRFFVGPRAQISRRRCQRGRAGRRMIAMRGIVVGPFLRLPPRSQGPRAVPRRSLFSTTDPGCAQAWR
eukprot:8225205-Lingulodinium_polyedra.AAC.1